MLDACRAYAQKYVDLQTEQFERIGCLGRWDKPYRTMSRDYEAKTLEAFYGFLEKGFIYRGLKPVYWCIHDRTALAEAEVEYENHMSPSIYVRCKLTSDPAAIAPALAGREVSTIIWTIMPWTLPASLAVAFHPDSDMWRWRTGGSATAAYIDVLGSWPRRRPRVKLGKLDNDKRARPIQRRCARSRHFSASIPGAVESGAFWRTDVIRRHRHRGGGYGALARRRRLSDCSPEATAST